MATHDAQQNAFAGQNWDVKSAYRIAKGRYSLRALQQERERRRVRESLFSRLFFLPLPRWQPAMVFLSVAPLLIVELHPVVPPLWTDLADLPQEALGLILIIVIPILAEPLPAVDVDSREQVRHFQSGRCAAICEHNRKAFGARQFLRKPMS